MTKQLSYLVIHCTATPEGRQVSANDIRRWHTSPTSQGGRGWRQVGYSDMIHLSGAVENLVPYNNDDIVDSWEITNEASGINSISRHIVYVGGVAADGETPKDTRTTTQRVTMSVYVREMIKNHSNIKIAGHNQFAKKACPSFDVPQWLRSIGVAEKNIYKP
jgi:N-acetylmuramoyl-L-alanine amidase